jgi:DNA-binding transcriptional regulator YdaS (Cro superfamily)
VTQRGLESDQVEYDHSSLGYRLSNESLYGAKRAVSNVVETLKLALDTVGSAAALARALGITQSHVSRLKKGTAGVGPELSLRLSRVIARPSLQGLRDDGHGELADLFQTLLDERDDERIAAKRSFADNLATLSEADFNRIYGLVESLAKATRRAASRRR